MRAFRNILMNLGILVLIFAVMIPAGQAEGQLGQYSIEVIAFFLSLTMAIVSALSYGMVGRRSTLAMRCIGATVVLFFGLSLTLFLLFQKPNLTQDIARYWIGATLPVLLVGFQGFCNRRNLALLLFGRASNP